MKAIKLQWEPVAGGLGSRDIYGWYRNKWDHKLSLVEGDRKIALGFMRKLDKDKYELYISKIIKAGSKEKARLRSETVFKNLVRRWARLSEPRWNSPDAKPDPNQSVIMLIGKHDHSLRVKGGEFVLPGVWYNSKGRPVKGQVIGWLPWPELKEVSHES